MAKFCPQCGRAIPQNAKFCCDCGAALSERAQGNQAQGNQRPDNFFADLVERWGAKSPWTREQEEAFMQAQTVCWGGDTKEWPDKPDFEPKDFVDALKISMTKYCRFVGRASRAEFWMFFAWQLIIAAIALHTTGNVVMLAFVVPSLASLARRLRDAGFSPWTLFLMLAPLVGGVALLVMAALAPTPGPNRFGPQPVKR